EWQRAYAEINRFEYDLSQAQTVMIKFWLAISKDEQAERFKAREQTPHKCFKITDEDWRNRERWDDYLQAAADMLEQTSSKTAPWHVIATDDKNTARLQILQTILKQLSGTLTCKLLFLLLSKERVATFLNSFGLLYLLDVF